MQYTSLAKKHSYTTPTNAESANTNSTITWRIHVPSTFTTNKELSTSQTQVKNSTRKVITTTNYSKRALEQTTTNTSKKRLLIDTDQTTLF
jgi:hypothetical protein